LRSRRNKEKEKKNCRILVELGEGRNVDGDHSWQRRAARVKSTGSH
jgi:hypothetical protein